MSRITIVTQTGSKTTSVESNRYDAIIQTVSLTDAADGSFVFTVNNNLVQDMTAILISSEYPATTGTTTRTATLTGSSGTANVTIDGVDYLATFATSLTVTAANWITANATALLALGYTATSNAAIITISALTVDFPTVAVTNVTGNLAGTIGTQTDTPSTGNILANLVSWTQGSFVVRIQNVGTAVLNTYGRFHYKITTN
jgi:hypothetical protein